jgi:Ca2+-binding EF-hand superfamily protein
MGRLDSELWRAKLTSVFSTWDRNGDGYVTVADLNEDMTHVAAALNVSTDSAAFAMIEDVYKLWTDQIFAELDTNGDHQISLEEFLDFFGEASTEQITDLSERYCAAVCVMADADGDDRLDHEEYVRWAMAANGASEADAEAAFGVIDADANGYITKEELLHAMVEYAVSVEEAPGNELFGPVAG